MEWRYLGVGVFEGHILPAVVLHQPQRARGACYPFHAPLPPDEDMIDFPCSDTFIRHYAAHGLTRDFPHDYWRAQEEAERAEQEEFERLVLRGVVEPTGGQLQQDAQAKLRAARIREVEDRAFKRKAVLHKSQGKHDYEGVHI